MDAIEGSLRGSARAVGVCSSRVGCSLPAQRNNKRSNRLQKHFYQENYRWIAVCLYLVGCDGVYDSFTKLLTVRCIAVICSLDDMQFVVRYKPCKLICMFHRYDLISWTVNCEEPGQRVDRWFENFVLAHPYNSTNLQEMKYFGFCKMHGKDHFNIKTVCCWFL